MAALRGGRSVLEVARAMSPLRVLLPKVAGMRAAWVCVTSFGGGLVRGDALELDARVEEGATLLVTTQSSTKAFRGSTRQTMRAQVDGTLVLWPDPVACFAGAEYHGEVLVQLGPQGSVVLVDSFTSGRAAFGEHWAFKRFTSRVKVERAENPVLIDATVLDARHGDIGARFGRVQAFATVVAVGARTSAVTDAMLAPGAARDVIVAPSKLGRDEGAMLRVAGERAEDVLREVRARLRNVVEICGVDPYGSRH